MLHSAFGGILDVSEKLRKQDGICRRSASEITCRQNRAKRVIDVVRDSVSQGAETLPLLFLRNFCLELLVANAEPCLFGDVFEDCRKVSNRPAFVF